MIRGTSVFVDGEERTGYILYALWPEGSAPSEQLDTRAPGWELRSHAHSGWLETVGTSPDLFTLEWMEGGALAGRTRESDLMSGIEAEGFMPLSEHQMRFLEQAARKTYGA